MQCGGASIHTHFGDLRGQPLFAVSVYPERTVRISGRQLSVSLIASYLRQNADLFRDPRVILGTWYNADEDTTYIDVTMICSAKDEAVRLAQANNQIAIYDLAHDAEIDMGGTGEAWSGLAPESELLP